MTRVFGEQPKPRLLVVGDVEDSDLRKRLGSLAPTVRFVTLVECQAAVNHREWDAVVLWDCDAEITSNACVVQFGGVQTGRIRHRGSTFNGRTGSSEPSTNYSAPENPVPEVAHLVEALAGKLILAGVSRIMTVNWKPASDVIKPFLLNSNDQAVAGVFRRTHDGTPQWWWLPPDVPDPHRWVEAALGHWRRVYPDRFEPEVSDWTLHSRWQTTE